MPTILIIEDESKMRRLLELNLGEDGFKTVSAPDAETGLKLLASEQIDLVKQISNMVEYIRKRAPGKIGFAINTHNREKIFAMISAPLFDWVIENLLKNAHDAMEGKGNITIDMRDEKDSVTIDVSEKSLGSGSTHWPAPVNGAKSEAPGFRTFRATSERAA